MINYQWILTGWQYAVAKVRHMFRRRQLNFIAIHYLYLISWTIVGSILLYPAGGLSYIDALFFAAGSSTQSGLNTVNINDMHTQQQVILYFIAMFCNPIVIHGAVIFVRLYWFEKRFQKEALSWRRTRSRSFMNQAVDEEKSHSSRDHEVRGKSIVLLNDGHKLGASDASHFKERNGAAIEGSASTSATGTESPQKDDASMESAKARASHAASADPDRPRREIVFADQVMASPEPTSPMRLPEPRSTEHSIAFLERQRNPEDHETLRIPGPRDFEQGKLPERVGTRDENGQVEDEATVRPSTNPEQRRSFSRSRGADKFKQSITIDASARPPPDHPPRRPISRATFPRVSSAASNNEPATDDQGRPKSRKRSATLSSFIKSTSTYPEPGPVPYLSWQPTLGRNSNFVDLTEEQREELGGIEYRSLKTLAVVVISYFLFWHILGIVVFLPWILNEDAWGSIVSSDGVNRTWWGIFSSATLFNDLGFTLTPDSFISFNTAVVPLLLGSILIVVGNTGFPAMLRLWIWILQKVVPESSGLWEELRFLLDHPRRCFTLLFPSSATWVLFAILILLNGIDLIFFIILDINVSAVDSLSGGFQVLNGLFQATSTRTAGTAVVNLADLHPGIQVSYLIMMYISVFPIAISMRRTNVYEERSLGVYDSSGPHDADEHEPSYIGAHLRKQLSFDLWFIFLGLFIIAIAEGARIADPNQPAFDLFSCLFEIVSAYGTVGLSLGYPGIDASFSAEFSVVSKLVIIGMMLRGRHRGLPYALDRAIELPRDESRRREADRDEGAPRSRRMSVSSGRSALRDEATAMSTGVATGTASKRDKDGLERLQSHASARHSRPAHDATAKLSEGIAHADMAVKDEIAKHRPSWASGGS